MPARFDLYHTVPQRWCLKMSSLLMKPGSDKLEQTQPWCALLLRGSALSMFVDVFVQCQNLPTLDFFLRMMRVLKICLAEVFKFIASERRIKEGK